MRKKRVFIIIVFVIFTWFSYNNNYNKKIIIPQNRYISYIKTQKNDTNQNNKIDYKGIKKEIQNRKKLQKNLVENYNNTFDPKIFTQITNNSIIIDNMRNLLNKNIS